MSLLADPPPSADPPATSGRSHRSRPLAALLALLGGIFGLHRLYLRAGVWWLYPLVSLPLIGWTFRTDPWFRQPGFFLLSLLAVITMIEAIVIGLQSDARWDARHNTGSGRRSANRWAPVLLAISGLILAAMLAMSVLAIALEAWFTMRLGR